MMQIFKHLLPHGDYLQSQTVEMVAHSRLLHVDVIRDEVYLWAQHDIADKEKPSVPRTFIVVGTGVEFTPAEGHTLHYIGTVITETVYVWHVYEQKRY